jgi:NAD(P) transhydrogenase
MNTTFHYPTMAEAYKVAAYDGYNRVFLSCLLEENQINFL